MALLTAVVALTLLTPSDQRASGRSDAPAGRGVSAALLVAEYGKSASGEDVQILRRYTFRNGRLDSTEDLVATPLLAVRYDIGENHIYRNRYVVTHWGDIVDIVDRRLLHEGEGEVVGIEGNLIVSKVDRLGRSGLFVYDLGMRSYRRLEAPGVWALPGFRSPDGSRSVDRNGAGTLWLHSLGARPVPLGEFRGGAFTFDCSSPNSLAVLWLGNRRILTHQGNGRIVVVDVETKKVKPVVNIPMGDDARGCPPLLSRDGDARPLYSWSGKVVAINVESGTYEPYPWRALGNGFFATEERDETFGHVIRFGDREIGRFWCDIWGAVSALGHLSIEYGPVGSNLGQPEGVKVWSEASRQWTAITLDVPMTVIGWVEDSPEPRAPRTLAISTRQPDSNR